MRGDRRVAYFYSFDEESSCRYVQVSKKYLEYTVDEYHYKEDKYDGNIEINNRYLSSLLHLLYIEKNWPKYISLTFCGI